MPRSKATASRWSRPISANTSSRSAARRRATSSRRPSTCTQDQVEADFRRLHTQAAGGPRSWSSPRSSSPRRAQILREKFLAADVGITGANFLIAETGSSVIVTNEGNGDLTQSLPKVHIVLASIEKMVPTLEDAEHAHPPAGALGDGPGDLDLHDVLDRPAARRRSGRPGGLPRRHPRQRPLGAAGHASSGEVLRCIRCGACMNHCPVYTRHRRPRLRLGLSGPDRRGADAGADRRAPRPGTCPTPPPSAGAARRSAR